MNKETNFFPTSDPAFKRVVLDLHYVVRSGDDEMIQHAKDCLYEDIMSLYKSDALYDCIRVVDAPDAEEDDIPEFLLPQEA